MEHWICILLLLFTVLPNSLQKPLIPILRDNVGSCDKIYEDSDIFGNLSHFSDKGLLTAAFIGGARIVPVTLKIIRIRLLSEATGLYRNTVSSASFLIEYLEPGKQNTQMTIVAMDCILDPHNPIKTYSFFPAPDPAGLAPDRNTLRVGVGTVLRHDNIEADFSTQPEFNCAQTGFLRANYSNTVTQCICEFKLQRKGRGGGRIK